MYNITVNRCSYTHYTSTVRVRQITLRQYTRKYMLSSKMKQKLKLFDNKIDLKLYKLIIIFMEKGQLCSTTKGQRAITFNNFMYREERTSQLL